MNTIGLMTLDAHSYNYGGLLQQYALFYTLNHLGYKCEVIDYNLLSEYNMFTYKRNLRYLTIRKIIEKAICMFSNMRPKHDIKATIESRHLVFNKFRHQYMTYSPLCDRKDITILQRNYDAVICGSDQIWNPSLCRPSFFLDFVDNDKKKIIYAASIGRSSLNRVEKNVYKSYLEGLRHISVREMKAKEILEPLVTDTEISVVLDPTLLIEPEKWKDIAGGCSPIEGRYVFCYFLGLNKEKRKSAFEFADRNNCRIISIPFLLEKYNELDDIFSTYTDPVGPAEFLNLILYAEYVLTDSFHASVFSILFNKPFRVFGRGAGKENMNSRIETLLEYIGHNDYLIAPSELKECIVEKKEVYDLSILERKKKQSISYLKNALLS